MFPGHAGDGEVKSKGDKGREPVTTAGRFCSCF